MIVILSTLIAIVIVLLCVYTLIYKHRFKEATNTTFEDIAVFNSFEQFESLYRIAPEKYKIGNGYQHSIRYRATIKDTINAGTKYERTIESFNYYELLESLLSS